jgi:hypothetical protein
LKIGILTAADAPLSYFPLLSPVLISLEKAIATQDISPWVQQAAAVFDASTTVEYQMPEWGLGVLFSDFRTTGGTTRPWRT